MRSLKQCMLLIMAMSVISFTSCSNDDDGGEEGAAGNGVLEATVDGRAFESFAAASSATVANNGDNLIIIAPNSEGVSISFTIIGYDGEGTYPLGGGSNIFNVAAYTETDVNNPTNTQAWQAPFDGTRVGELRISDESDDSVSGTFEFSAKNTGGDQSVVTITNGSFNLTKRTQ